MSSEEGVWGPSDYSLRKQYLACNEKSLASHVLSSEKEIMVQKAEVCAPLHLYLFTDVLAKCFGAELGGPRMPELAI